REAPRRVRIMRGAPGVRVARHGAHAEVAVEDALSAERELCPALAVKRTALLQRAVRVGESGLEREEPGEVRAAGFLFAFDQQAHADRQLAENGTVRFDRLDPQEQVSLVVVDTARVDGPALDRWRVGRRRP